MSAVARELWPHQVEAISRARAAMGEGHSKIVVQVPTGGGKTVIGTEVAKAAAAKGRKVLWLAHRRELVDQAADTLEGAGLGVGVISAARSWRANPDAPVQVASLQTLLARDLRPEADLIIPDECHHLSQDGAKYWTSLLEAYPNTRVLGLTATPERSDGEGLAPLFTSLIQVCSVRDLTRTGDDDAHKPLVAARVERPGHYLKKRGVPGLPLAQHPVEAYQEKASGTQAIMFCRSVSEAEDFARQFRDAGIEARCVTGETAGWDRSDAVESFRAGTVRVLTNVYCFTEGTDLPMASTCILARGCSTAGTYLQMVGRVLRRAPGKASALLLDLPGVSHLFGMPEDERLWRLEGKACKLLDGETLCKVCGKPVLEPPSVDEPCPHCEWKGPAEEEEERDFGQTTIERHALQPFTRAIKGGPQQRHETALRWAQETFLRGWRPGVVFHRYEAIYKEKMPPTTWLLVKQICADGMLRP